MSSVIDKLFAKGCNKILKLILDVIPQKHQFYQMPREIEKQILESRVLLKDAFIEDIIVKGARGADPERKRQLLANITRR